MSRETQREQLHQQLREKLEQGAKPVSTVQTEFPATGFIPPELTPIAGEGELEAVTFPVEEGRLEEGRLPGGWGPKKLRSKWQDDPRWRQPGTRYEFSPKFGDWVPSEWLKEQAEILLRPDLCGGVVGTGELEGDVLSDALVRQPRRGLNLTWI